jgi:hypothetical protein
VVTKIPLNAKNLLANVKKETSYVLLVWNLVLLDRAEADLSGDVVGLKSIY